MGRDTVNFNANVPVELSLAFPEGKFVDGKFGQRVMCSLDVPAGQVMFLSPAVAQKINAQRIQPGEHFFICKRPKNGAVPPRWDIWLAPVTEQERAAAEKRQACPTLPTPAQPEQASLLERQLAASIHEAQLRKAPARAGAIVPLAATGTNGSTGSAAIPSHPTISPVPAVGPTWVRRLIGTTNALTEAYAVALDHASKAYGNQVKPEDVRALLTTAYIALTKNGATHAG